MATAATLIAALFLAVTYYRITRLISPHQGYLPPLTRLRGRRAAIEEQEWWRTGLLHGRIGTRSYQQRTSSLGHGRRVTRSVGQIDLCY
ncbi:hypothetical protein ACFV1X_26515 [Streptomyces coelicoflavus]|uniref:hypothetical protein n=1 Tax=Streptomyces coelicoflavus TaxID=285562 RepID=UPI0036754B5A